MSVKLSNNILEQMQRNLVNVPTLRWQYYANEDGEIVTYPATQKCLTDSEDPRMRYDNVQLK
jgi:hypothetical protein